LETSWQQTRTDQTHLRRLCYHYSSYSGNESTSLPFNSISYFFWHYNQIWDCYGYTIRGRMQNIFQRYSLTHDAQRLQLTTLHSLSRILLPYYSMISWYCRKWGSIFAITFYQSNYLSTILHSTQSTEWSHQLPLNINDPGHGQPWRLFLAKCRERLSFVIYASRCALYYSTSLQSLLSACALPEHQRDFSIYNFVTLRQQQESCSLNSCNLCCITIYPLSFQLCR